MFFLYQQREQNMCKSYINRLICILDVYLYRTGVDKELLFAVCLVLCLPFSFGIVWYTVCDKESLPMLDELLVNQLKFFLGDVLKIIMVASPFLC